VISPLVRPLNEFAARLMPDQVRASVGPDDLVQDVLIKGMAQLHRFEFRHRGAFQAYLRTSIRHRIVDELRKASRRRVAALEAKPVDGARSPLEQAINKQNVKRYARALTGLGQRDQRLIVLRIEQQLSYSEMAAQLGVSSEHAVRVPVRRALLRLAHELRQIDGRTHSRAFDGA
jgi:RNA polymerase sigma factor (sigma-70 family)